MKKMYDSQSFDLGHDLTAHCHTENTRYGFRHLATLRRFGTQITHAKACYYNRTWERFTYESVLLALIEKAKTHLSPAEQDDARAAVKNYKEPNPFNPTLALFALAEIMTPDQATANTLKKSALAAIPGIDLPENWDSLPEEEKTRRLQSVQKVLGETP